LPKIIVLEQFTVNKQEEADKEYREFMISKHDALIIDGKKRCTSLYLFLAKYHLNFENLHGAREHKCDQPHIIY
jgi:hypothetical protein